MFEQLTGVASDEAGLSCPKCKGHKVKRVFGAFGVKMADAKSSAPSPDCAKGGDCSSCPMKH